MNQPLSPLAGAAAPSPAPRPAPSPAPFTAARYHRVADRLGVLAGGAGPTVLVQAEAVVALEALAHGLGRSARPVLSIESSRYGRWSTGWLRAAGAPVTALELPDGELVDPDRVDDLLARLPGAAVVVVTQAETLTGVVHPVDRLAEVAHAHGALLAVDAVAAVGGLPAPRDADAVVVGPQKAVQGPAGLSAVTLSEAGWALLESAQDPRTPSVLNLPYLRRADELGTVPGTPSVLELVAAEDALDALDREGLAVRLDRHARTRDAVRAGLRAAGLTPWVREDAAASTLATTVAVPAGADAAGLAALAQAAGGRWEVGGATPRGPYLRVGHHGRDAGLPRALTEVVTLAAAARDLGLPADPGAGAVAAARAWAGTP